MDTEDMNSTETIPHVFVCRHGERIDFVEQDWWKTSERFVSLFLDLKYLFG